jgi:hypothetical protein
MPGHHLEDGQTANSGLQPCEGLYEPSQGLVSDLLHAKYVLRFRQPK